MNMSSHVISDITGGSALSQPWFENHEGIWVRNDRTSATIDYPEDGAERCYRVEDRSFWFQHRNNAIAAAIASFPPHGPILDVGGGNGYVTKRLLDNGYRVMLLEPGYIGARTAKMARGIPDVMCAAIENCGFPEGALSAIGCFDVLEHIADDAEFLEHVRYLLKDNGYFYFTVPAHQWLWSQNDDHARHHRRYCRNVLEHLLGDGLCLRYFTYFFGVLVVPIYCCRALPWKLGIRRKSYVANIEREHATMLPTRILRGLEMLLNIEVQHIKSGKSMMLGTSCLGVAQKTS